MKLSSAALAFVSVLGISAVGCGSSDSCVNGSGTIVSQTLDLTALTGIDFQTAGEVTVRPGTTQVVMVRGEENVIELLNRDVINGVWEIGFTDCVRDVSELRIDITVPELDSVELSGAGTIIAETNADEIATTLSGAGTITLSGSTTRQDVVLDGSGTIEAFDLLAVDTTVSLAGQGTINVSTSETLNVDLSGAGAVFYQGDPELAIRISGAGTVSAFE